MGERGFGKGSFHNLGLLSRDLTLRSSEGGKITLLTRARRFLRRMMAAER